MDKFISKAVAGLAIFATASAQAAPPATCLEKAELHGMIAYFLPEVLREVATTCAPHLPAGSYLRSGLSPMMSDLQNGKAAAWPVAKAAFLKIGDPKDAKAMAALPDADLRPLIDTAMAQKIKIPVSATTCGEVNDIAEALAPLSPAQTVDLITAIFGAVGRNGKSLQTCPRESK